MKVDFQKVNRSALTSIDLVLSRWVPGGKRQGDEYLPLNPKRSDNHSGSFSINTNTGAWSDFSTGDKGGDLISLIAYLENLSQKDACHHLAKFLSVDATSNPHGTTSSAERKPKAKTNIWNPILPAPKEALPNCPTKHPSLGVASFVWEYLNNDGALLMKVFRFDRPNTTTGDRSKEYRPLIFAHNTKDNQRAWRWMTPPNHRPLYGLDQLAKYSNSSVLLCEGEKAADAAKILFPDHVVITWPGGSKAIEKADFSPLKNRNIIFWPDNDEPGITCIKILTSKLSAIGAATFDLIDINQFAQRPITQKDNVSFEPGGSWPKGADAADALETGWTAEHIKQLKQNHSSFLTRLLPRAQQQTSNGEMLPTSTENPTRFVVLSGGVFMTEITKGPDGHSKTEHHRISDRLEILAMTRDSEKNNWGLLVKFKDPDGIEKEWNIPAELLSPETGKEVQSTLQNMGFRFDARSRRKYFMEFLLSMMPSERVTLVHKLGWHNGAYLLHDELIGNPSEPIHFVSKGMQSSKSSQAGTLQKWQQEIAKYCENNHLLAFSVSMAFAAPLLDILGGESGGFHFFGDSSLGKTTLLKVAASVYGGPDYVRTWRSTDNALEGIAANHSDGLLILDEIGQCDPRIIGDSVYMLGNGQGKARATDRGLSRTVAEWRLLFLSSGEKTLADHMAEANKKLKAGMDVRMLALPADAGKGLGVFDDLCNFAQGAALSNYLTEAAAKYHGVASRAFLKALIEQTQRGRLASRIKNTSTKFAHEHLSETASGQSRRASDRFSLVGFAGELASELGITGWKKGAALKAANECFNSWRNCRGGDGSLEDVQILQQVKLFFENNGETHFKRWDIDGEKASNDEPVKIDEHVPAAANRCGFRRTETIRDPLGVDTTETYYLVFPTSFREIVCKGFSARKVAELLHTSGALEVDSQGNRSVSIRMPGYGSRKTRAYKIYPHRIAVPGDMPLEQAS